MSSTQYIIFGVIILVCLTMLEAEATVEIYDGELDCPIDSFDFDDMYIEFDYVEMCEVVGNIIFFDPRTGVTSLQGLNLDQLINDAVNSTNTEKKKSLRMQFDERIDKVRNDLRAKLQKLIEEKIALTGKITDLKNFLSQLIIDLQNSLNVLQSDLKNPKTGRINIDDIISREEIENIVKRAINAQFIIPAFGELNNYDLKSRINVLIDNMRQSDNLKKENELLQLRIQAIQNDISKVNTENIKIQSRLAEIKNMIKSGIDDFIDNTGKLKNTTKIHIDPKTSSKEMIEKTIQEIEKGKNIITKEGNDILEKMRSWLKK